MNIQMKSAQSGFTLIELVVVIVILGILAATALPKFIDLTGNANQAAVQGVAGGLSSASSINYGGCAVANNAVGATCTKVSSCADAGSLLNPPLTLSSSPAQYSATGTSSAANGTSMACTLVLNSSPAVSAAYTAIAAGN